MKVEKLLPAHRVVCICRRGQVRSVALRNILIETFGFCNVLSCGWENNSADTVAMLCEWADVILVIGSTSIWPHVPSSRFLHKSYHFNIGADIWGDYRSADLHRIIMPMVEGLIE